MRLETGICVDAPARPRIAIALDYVCLVFNRQSREIIVEQQRRRNGFRIQSENTALKPRNRTKATRRRVRGTAAAEINHRKCAGLVLKARVYSRSRFDSSFTSNILGIFGRECYSRPAD